MPLPRKAGPSRPRVLALAIVASLGCSTLPSEPVPTNVIATDSHEAQLDSLVSPIPRESIPCGRAHGLVIDEDAMRVLGDVRVEFVSAADRVSATSSSGRYFEFHPVDTAVFAVRVIRKGSIPVEAASFPFRTDQGHRMILLLSARGLSWYMQSGYCPGQGGDNRTPENEPMVYAPRMGGGGK